MKFSTGTVLLGYALLAPILKTTLAFPAPAPLNSRGTITLPIHRVQPSRTDVHPQLMLQQHINRGQRRLARMNRRAGPSDSELEAHLVRRMSSLSESGYSKRSDPSGSEGVTTAEPPTASGSLGLDIEGADLGYFAAIQIGTPPRDYRITMDSGSSDFWVGGEGCKAKSGDGDCGTNHRFLGPESSSTFVDTEKPWATEYGSGSVSGNIVTDNIVIAGMALEQHTFGVAYKESSDFSDNSIPYDGLMGLALAPISDQKTITPVEAMVKNGFINEAITSYKISRAADDVNDGEITFGGLDSTKFDAESLVTVDNVSEDGFWEADIGTVSVDGVDMKLDQRTAILDTGTTLIIAPSSDAKKIHAAIEGAKPDGEGGFTVPCTTTAKISMQFGNVVFDIDSRDLAAEPVDSNDPTGDCVSGIAADTEEDDGAKQWLLGDVFLKNAYFSTNASKNTISLAKLV